MKESTTLTHILKSPIYHHAIQQNDILQNDIQGLILYNCNEYIISQSVCPQKFFFKHSPMCVGKARSPSQSGAPKCMQTDRANMTCQDNVCTRIFELGLASSECFYCTTNSINTVKIQETYCVVKSCQYLISPRLSLCVYYV